MGGMSGMNGMRSQMTDCKIFNRFLGVCDIQYRDFCNTTFKASSLDMPYENVDANIT